MVGKSESLIMFFRGNTLMERRFLLSMIINPILAGLMIGGTMILWTWIGQGWEEVSYLNE